MEEHYEKEIEAWWNDFREAEDAPEMVEKIKEICALDRPIEFYEELDIGTALLEWLRDEFKNDENMEGFHRFLEFMRKEYPGILALQPFCTRSLLYHHISKNEDEEVRDTVRFLNEYPKEDPDIIFDLSDALIVNEFPRLAGEMLETYYPIFKEGNEIIPGGCTRVAERLSWIFIADHINNGFVTEEKHLRELEEKMAKFDFEYRKREYLVEVIQKFSGKREKWSEKDFYGGNKIENLYHLLWEFVYYLKDEKNIGLVCAQFLQNCAYQYFVDESNEENEPIYKLVEENVDKYLYSWAAPLSMRRIKAFAILSGLKLFYDFLRDRNLVEKGTYEQAMGIIASLKGYLWEVFKQELHKYPFAEKWIGNIEEEHQQALVETRGSVKGVWVEGKKVGRNDPCPCGSGKKYKKCCGSLS